MLSQSLTDIFSVLKSDKLLYAFVRISALSRLNIGSSCQEAMSELFIDLVCFGLNELDSLDIQIFVLKLKISFCLL